MTNGSGLAGMFDPDMARLLLGFEVGSATLLRLAGFLAPTVACAVFANRLGSRPPTRSHFHALGAMHAFSLLLLLASFTLAGHIAVLGAARQSLHYLAYSGSQRLGRSFSSLAVSVPEQQRGKLSRPP